MLMNRKKHTNIFILVLYLVKNDLLTGEYFIKAINLILFISVFKMTVWVGGSGGLYCAHTC